MKIYRWYLGVAITLYSAIAPAANCTPFDVVGEITRIVKDGTKGNALVIRAACPAKERAGAYVYQKLYRGDRIEITGTTKVYALQAKGKELTFTKKTNQQPLDDKIIKNNDESRNDWFDFIKNLGSKIIIIVTEPVNSKPIPYSGAVRGSDLFMNDPLLPSGKQFLPVNYEQAALLWRGSSANIVISTPQGHIERSSEKKAFAIVPIPQINQEITIKLQGSAIAWDIQLSPPPTPPGMSQPDPTSAPARLIRALWILSEGPIEWHLFALSELANLSEMGYFTAEKLWNAALSGELATALGKKKI